MPSKKNSVKKPAEESPDSESDPEDEGGNFTDRASVKDSSPESESTKPSQKVAASDVSEIELSPTSAAENDANSLPFRDVKEVIEVNAVGLNSNDEVIKYHLRIPDGIEQGATLEDIDGKGHSVTLPANYGGGDSIIILLPKEFEKLKNGQLELPNRNCPHAYIPNSLDGDMFYFEGHIEEEIVRNSNNSDVASITYHFHCDCDGIKYEDVDLDRLFDISPDEGGKKKIKVGSQILAYGAGTHEYLDPGKISSIRDLDGTVYACIDFENGDKTRVLPSWVFEKKKYTTIHRSLSGHSSKKVQNDTNDILSSLNFPMDTGLNSIVLQDPGTAMLAVIGCYNNDTTEKTAAIPKHLSSKRAIFHRDTRSVRKLTPDGTYEYFKFSETFIPFYWFPGIEWFSPKSRDGVSFLDTYGFGVVSYFKLLKSLIVIFVLMTAITLPSAVLFGWGNSTPERELYYLSQVNTLTGLAYSSIAALSEPILLCRDGIESETLSLTCPDNYKLRSVTAYYGQPTGSCGCPNYQQVSTVAGSTGDCFSESAIASDGSSYCLPAISADLRVNGYTYGCFGSTDRFGNSCCAFMEGNSTSNTGQINYFPDLSDLNVAPKAECNSVSAQYIATLLCEGQQSCSIDIDGSANIEFLLDDILQIGNYTNVCGSMSAYWPGVPTTCSTNLERGIFSGCSAAQTIKYPIYNKTEERVNFKDRKMIMEGICEVEEIDINGESYSPVEIVEISAYLNAIATLIFVLGVTWIKIQQKKDADALSHKKVTSADYTIVTRTLPKNSKDLSVKQVKQQLKEFFEDILFDENDGAPIEVADVNLVTSVDDYLNKCVDRGDAAEEVDLVIARIESQIRRKVWNPTTDSSKALLLSLKEVLLEFEYANDICLESSADAEHNNHMAYVTFAQEDGYLKALRKYPNIGIFTGVSQPKQEKLDNATVHVSPAPEALEIIYENLAVSGFSRMLRVISTTAATIIFLGISYIFIYQARIFSDSYQAIQINIDCSTYSVELGKSGSNTTAGPNIITYFDVLQDTYPSAYGLNVTNSDWGSKNYAKCYCSEVLYGAYLEGSADPNLDMTSYTFTHPDSNEEVELCSSATTVLSTFFSLFSTFVVVLINMFLVRVLSTMVDFERHATKTGKLLSVCFKLFIAQYINTALLTLIIAGDLSAVGVGTNLSFSLNNVQYLSEIEFGVFTGVITDYNTDWYFSVGASLLFTMCIFSIGQLPPQYMNVFMQKMKRLWDRRWSFKHGFTLKNTQEELDASYLGPPMPLQEKYSYLLTLIFVDMTYSPTMPLFNLITLGNLIVFYLSDMYTLLYFFQKPAFINEVLPDSVLNCLLVAALIHIGNGMWMFGNKAFYDPEVGVSYSAYDVWDSTGNNNVTFVSATRTASEDIDWIERGTNNYSTILGVLLIGYFIFVFFGFLRHFFLETLGIRTFVRALGNMLERSCPSWNFIGVKKIKPNGYPSYFESLTSSVLRQRVLEHTLDENIESKYIDYITTEENDKKEMGKDYSAEKSRQKRASKANVAFEAKRRESLLKSSLDDTSRVSLDNLDASHDVSDVMVDNITGRHSQKKHIHHAVESTMPNKNCPIAYTQRGGRDKGFYEGEYLQYTDVETGSTVFTFMKHDLDLDKQLKQHQVDNCNPSDVCILERPKHVPFEYEKEEKNIPDTEEYNKSITKDSRDIPLFVVGEKVIAYKGVDEKSLVIGEITDIDEQISAENDKIDTFVEKSHFSWSSNSNDAGNPNDTIKNKYFTDYRKNINSRTQDSKVTVTFQDGKSMTLNVAWVWLHRSLSNNRTGKFSVDSGIEFMNLIASGNNHSCDESYANTNTGTSEKRSTFSYHGKIANGSPTGDARTVYENGDSYKGHFLKGLFHGIGAYTWFSEEEENKCYYRGEFFKGLKQGLGTYIYNGNESYVYNGEYFCDKAHGYGKKVFTDGSGRIQVGEWNAGVAVVENNKNMTFGKGALVENSDDCCACLPTYDDDSKDLLKDGCGNIVYECTGCCVCKSCTCGKHNQGKSDNNLAQFEEDLSGIAKRIENSAAAGLDLLSLVSSTSSQSKANRDALTLEGHESYNINTVPEYQNKFGLETTHMARAAPTDLIMQVSHLPDIVDDDVIKDIFSECAPYKLKKTIIDESGAERDIYVVPEHSLWLKRNVPRMCGGVGLFNDKLGCECLAEPADDGSQPKYHCCL